MQSQYLSSIKKQFEYYKTVGDKTFAQLEEEDLFWQYNAQSNSIAIIVNFPASASVSLLTFAKRSRYTIYIGLNEEKI